MQQDSEAQSSAGRRRTGQIGRMDGVRCKCMEVHASAAEVLDGLSMAHLNRLESAETMGCWSGLRHTGPLEGCNTVCCKLKTLVGALSDAEPAVFFAVDT